MRPLFLTLCVLLAVNGLTAFAPASNRWDSELIRYARTGDINGVKDALAKGADINARDGRGGTALINAAFFNHTLTVKLLLERGANTDLCDHTGLTALASAIQPKKPYLATVLLNYGADPNVKGRSSHGWHGEMTNQGFTPLILASKECLQHMAELLLNHGAGVDVADDQGKNPLMYACDERRRWCEKKDWRTMAMLLLDHGAKVDARDKHGMTPLMYAADSCLVDVAKRLIKEGARIEARDNMGRTALDFASSSECSEMMEDLISRGANVHSKVNDGRTIAMRAAELYRIGALRRLRDHGAEMDVRAAVILNDKKLLLSLIRKGLELNRPGEQGRTPLMDALLFNKYALRHCTKHSTPYEIIRILIEKGADLSIKDHWGKTALDIAINWNLNPEIVNLLEDHGASASWLSWFRYWTRKPKRDQAPPVIVPSARPKIYGGSGLMHECE